MGRTELIEDPIGQVRSVTGDAVLFDTAICLIKIDVEGMEFDVLSGLEGTIERSRPVIFIEVWPGRAAEAQLSEWCTRFAYVVIREFEHYNYLLVPGESLDGVRTTGGAGL